MFADPDIHIVYNPLPNHLHAEWTIKALEAGKHVLCEKPFAITLAEVDAMYAAAHKANRVLAEAFMYRHHPKTLKVKELVESGALGEVHFMRASFSFYLDRPHDIRWQAEMGGGALWDVGCYPVSLARYLFGAPERVTAWQRRWPATGVDQLLTGTLYFPGERVAQFDCSFQMPYRTHAEIVGDKGRLTLTRPFQPDFPEAKLLLQRGDTVEEIQLPNPGRYEGEVEDMHDAILLGKPPLITPAETRGHVETILELYRAAA
jgi:predicted dehydrogenase